MRRSRSPSAPKRTPSTCAPPSFLCPIGCEIMRDPVTCADGHSYERANIERWLATNNTSPRTGAQLPNKALTPNHALRNAVEEWLNSFLREDALHRADMPSNSLGEGGGGDVRGLEGGGEGATKMVAKVVAKVVAKMSLIVVVVSLLTGVLAFFDKFSAGRMPWESTDRSPIGLVLCALTMVVVSLAYLAFKVAQLQIALKAARAAGFTIKDAKEAGFTCKDAREAGMLSTCKDAREAGFTCKDAREAGFKPRDCAQAGFTYEEARAAGFASHVHIQGKSYESGPQYEHNNVNWDWDGTYLGR